MPHGIASYTTETEEFRRLRDWARGKGREERERDKERGRRNKRKKEIEEV